MSFGRESASQAGRNSRNGAKVDRASRLAPTTAPASAAAPGVGARPQLNNASPTQAVNAPKNSWMLSVPACWSVSGSKASAAPAASPASGPAAAAASPAASAASARPQAPCARQKKPAGPPPSGLSASARGNRGARVAPGARGASSDGSSTDKVPERRFSAAW